MINRKNNGEIVEISQKYPELEDLNTEVKPVAPIISYGVLVLTLVNSLGLSIIFFQGFFHGSLLLAVAEKPTPNLVQTTNGSSLEVEPIPHDARNLKSVKKFFV